MFPQPLVDTDWLAKHQSDEHLRVFDTTVFLVPDPGGRPPYRIESGLASYTSSHVPGAGFLDLTRELSDRNSRMPFMMPGEAQLSDALSRSGISADSQVVLYSASSMMWSTRVWWMLRAVGLGEVGLGAVGLGAVAVLDGGWEKWQREGRPVASEPCSYPPGSFEARLQPGLLVGKDEVASAIGAASTCTVNALSPEVYAGTAATHYGRPGHIPGSHNVFYNHLLDRETGTFLEPDELRQRLARELHSERVITYCGGGISATMPALALILLGHPNVAVYDGSLTEWAADAELPLVTGADPG